MKIKFLITYAVYLLIVAAFFSSTQAIAEDPIPFKAMMQSSSTDLATPKPDTKDVYNQTITSKHTSTGKAERVAGGVLLGAGIVSVTLGTVAYVLDPHHDQGRIWAGIGGGAGMAGAGVTLIVVGNHKRKSN